MTQTQVEVDPAGAHLVEVEGIGRWNRLKGHPAVRDLVPRRLAVLGAIVRGRRRWRRDLDARSAAIVWARAALGADSDPDEVNDLARRAVIEEEVRTEFEWRLHSAARLRVGGIHRLQEALDKGSGAVVMLAPAGARLALVCALARQGMRPHLPTKRSVSMRQDFAGVAGWRRRQMYAALERAGVLFTRADAIPGVLAGAGLVVIPAAALGRVDLGEAPVFVGFALRKRTAQRLWLSEPIAPAVHPGGTEAHVAARADAAIGAVLEQVYPEPAAPGQIAARAAAVREARAAARASRRHHRYQERGTERERSERGRALAARNQPKRKQRKPKRRDQLLLAREKKAQERERGTRAQRLSDEPCDKR